jgi:hypothetical protein
MLMKDGPALPTPESDEDAAALFRTVAGGACASMDVTADGEAWTLHSLDIAVAYPRSERRTTLRRQWMVGEELAGHLVNADGSAGPQEGYTRVSKMDDSDPVAGGWDLATPGWSGALILTGTHYHYVIASDDRPVGVSRESSDGELAELFRTTLLEAGSNTISGDTLLAVPEHAINRSVHGVGQERRFGVEGNSLEIEIAGRDWRFERDK